MIIMATTKIGTKLTGRKGQFQKSWEPKSLEILWLKWICTRVRTQSLGTFTRCNLATFELRINRNKTHVGHTCVPSLESVMSVWRPHRLVTQLKLYQTSVHYVSTKTRQHRTCLMWYQVTANLILCKSQYFYINTRVFNLTLRHTWSLNTYLHQQTKIS